MEARAWWDPSDAKGRKPTVIAVRAIHPIFDHSASCQRAFPVVQKAVRVVNLASFNCRIGITREATFALYSTLTHRFRPRVV